MFGTLTRKSLSALLVPFAIWGAATAQNVTIPSANTNTGGTRYPLGAVNGYERSAAIYFSSEIGMSGNIDSIGWYINSVSSPAASVPVQIYLKQTSAVNFVAAGTLVSDELNGATLVYSGTMTSGALSAGNWINFGLTASFSYNSSSNLEVIVLTNYGGTGSGESTTAKAVRYATQAQTHQTWTQNTTAPTTAGTRDGKRPNIRLKITPPSTPLTFLSGAVTQNNTFSVARASKNNEIIGVTVVMSSTGAATSITDMSFNTNGSSDTSNIRNIRVWYTGSSKTFATTTQFGSTLSRLPGTSFFTITGSKALSPDTNYFWLTYDIDTNSTIGNVVDAECTSMTIGTNPAYPIPSSATGSRIIGPAYCEPSYTYDCSSDDFINRVSTTGGSTNINNTGSGCSGNPNNFTFYASQVLTVRQGDVFSLSVRSGASTGYDEGFKVWIDYNKDGVYDPSELIYTVAPTTALSTGNVTIPLTAPTGVTRMRVRCAYNVIPTSACGNETYGETEDYLVNIQSAPSVPTVYAWSGATTNITTPGNWLPARNYANITDVLSFKTGTAISVTNLVSMSVSQLIVDSNTTVTLSGTAGTVLNVTDQLQLLSGKIIAGANINLMLGTGTASTGTLNGTGTLECIFTRWISNASPTAFTFPMGSGGNVRTATVDYILAPTTGGTLTAQFIPGDPGNTGLPLTDGPYTANKAANSGIWRFTAGNGLAGGDFSFTFKAAGFNGVNNYSSLLLIRRDNSTSPWSLNGYHINTTGTNAEPVLSRMVVSTYGEFTAGGDSAVNALPVTLLNFEAHAAGKDVQLGWQTGSETNNKGFEIERSADAAEFTPVQFVAGKHNSTSTAAYAATDVNAFNAAPVLYYRLKQLDLDGRCTYSQTVKVSRDRVIPAHVNLYPNPADLQVNISLRSEATGQAQVTVSDISGKTVYTQSIELQAGDNLHRSAELDRLPGGMYFLEVSGPGNLHEMIKWVKTRN